MTFSIYLAKNKIIPPKEFIHNRTLKNKEGKTVYDYLKEY